MRARHLEGVLRIDRLVYPTPWSRALYQGELLPDTPAARLMVRGWSAMTEDVVLAWAADPAGVSREELLAALTASLPGLVELLH